MASSLQKLRSFLQGNEDSRSIGYAYLAGYHDSWFEDISSLARNIQLESSFIEAWQTYNEGRYWHADTIGNCILETDPIRDDWGFQLFWVRYVMGAKEVYDLQVAILRTTFATQKMTFIVTPSSLEQRFAGKL